MRRLHQRLYREDALLGGSASGKGVAGRGFRSERFLWTGQGVRAGGERSKREREKEWGEGAMGAEAFAFGCTLHYTRDWWCSLPDIYMPFVS
jgi:hypothetical protein